MATPLTRDYLVLFIQQGQLHQLQARAGVFAAAVDCAFPLHILTSAKRESPAFKSRHCRGIIGFFVSGEDHAFARAMPVPAINLSNTSGPVKEVGNVLCDEEAVGRVAAQHLLSRGHRCLIGFGQNHRSWSDERLRGFAAEAQASGATVHCQNLSLSPKENPNKDWSPLDYMTPRVEALRAILAEVPPDTGVFAANDHIAWMVQHAMFTHFPERLHTLGLMGAGDQEPSAYTPNELRGMTSVRIAFRRMGREALRWFFTNPTAAKESAAKVLHRVSPEGLAIRASTAGKACRHPQVARGMRWAWEQLRVGQVPKVKDLAEKLAMSPRTLERLCQEYAGESAREQLLGMRLDYACQLLREASEMSVGEIGERCGFLKAGHFAATFKAHLGKTPLHYRNGK